MGAPLLVRIETPHFVAGLEIEGGRVVRAAPILKYMVGWPATRVREYAHRRAWRATRPRPRP